MQNFIYYIHIGAQNEFIFSIDIRKKKRIINTIFTFRGNLSL